MTVGDSFFLKSRKSKKREQREDDNVNVERYREIGISVVTRHQAAAAAMSEPAR